MRQLFAGAPGFEKHEHLFAGIHETRDVGLKDILDVIRIRFGEGIVSFIMGVEFAEAEIAFPKNALTQFHGAKVVLDQATAEPARKFAGVPEHRGKRDDLWVIAGVEHFQKRQLQTPATFRVGDHLNFIDQDEVDGREEVDILDEELVEFFDDENAKVEAAAFEVGIEVFTIGGGNCDADTEGRIARVEFGVAFLGDGF